MHRPSLRQFAWLPAWLPACLALAIALLPTLVLGFPRGHDWLLELTRIAEYGHSLGDGQLPPHWAPNVYSGHGAPVFLFYSPLFLIVASAATAVVGSVATGAVAAIWFFAGTGLVALTDLVRSITPHRSAARVAVLLFALHPYLLTDALLRNANAEFAALCLLPLPLAGVVRLASGKRGGALRLGAGLALVVLAHNLTALVAAAAVAVLGVVLLWDAAQRIQLRFVLAFAGGLLLSAWLWLPALGYRHLIRQDELTRGGLDFHGNFGKVFGWGNYYAVGYLPALALVGGAVWLVARRPAGQLGRIAWTLAAASAVFLLLQTPRSTALWDATPFLPLFQFPWRFQGPLAMCTAVLAAIAWCQTPWSKTPSRQLIAEWLLLIVLVLNAWPHLSRVRPLPDEAQRGLAAWTTPDGIRTRGLKVTVGNEYLPAAGLDPATLPYGPDRVPPLRRLGLALSLASALAWIGVAVRRRIEAWTSARAAGSVG